MNGDTLLVVPALRAERHRDGSFLLTRKFVDGAAVYARLWPGPVRVAVQAIERARPNLDLEPIAPDSQPFQLQWLDMDETAVIELVRGHRFVLSSLVPAHERMSRLCRAAGVPMAYVTEYTLQTRRQIIEAETANPIRRWRRYLYEHRREQRNCEAVRLATGLQCNGTPTFDAYRSINERSLLYFDTRVSSDMLADPVVVEARTAELLAGGPLRLCFSGRLMAMKGVDHLPVVADELRRLGVDFTMDICGGGDREPVMRRAIERRGLADRVRLRGVLDFKCELLPHLARHVDLFVVCHPQGDPACTYLETMSCGTPIIGYDNEAWAGIVRTLKVGWTTPLGDPAALARRIAELDRNRTALAAGGTDALVAAEDHTFQETMQRRIDHMLACCGAVSMEVGA